MVPFHMCTNAGAGVAQDHRRPCLPRCRCENLEHATTGDHVIAVTADFQACIEDGTVWQIARQCTLAATAVLTLASIA